MPMRYRWELSSFVKIGLWLGTECLGDVTAHAEMQAITSAAASLGGKYLTDCTLYVTLEPCVMCAGAIGWAQLARVVFGAGDEKRGYRRFAPQVLHPKTEVECGVLNQSPKQRRISLLGIFSTIFAMKTGR